MPGELVLVRTISRCLSDKPGDDRFSLGLLKNIDDASLHIEQPEFVLAKPVPFGGCDRAMIYPSLNRVFCFADTRVLKLGREEISSYLRGSVGWDATADWVDSLEKPYLAER